MKPALRRILAVTAPVAVLAAASTASAGLLDAHPYLTDNKAYPTVVGTDGSSYVDVALRWAPHLLRRSTKAHEMRVTLTGKGRKGAPIRFDAKTVKRNGANRYEVVRLRIKKKQRGAYANARNVVVSSAHHWVAPSKGSTGLAAAKGSNLVAVSNANVKGTVGKSPYSLRAVRDCDVATLGPNSNAAGCDFSGANLAGAKLTNANLSGATLDLANLAGADLSNANVTGTSMVGTNIAGANFGATSQAAYTMPQAADPSQGTSAVCKQTGGGPMCEAVYSAKSTIGAVYYQFAGPNVTTWLQDALRRGVNVFIIENSANTVGGLQTGAALCQHNSNPADPLGNRQEWINDQTCAWSPKADPFYALEYQLKNTKMADGTTPAPGKVRVQFSSENFNITHQKSILVDVLDPSGKALSGDAIAAAGGSAVVSSGNLQAFPNAWGQRTMSVNGTPTVVNPNYLESPAASCAFAEDKKCDAEWTPRDFAMKVTDPQILSRIAAVYASDLACDSASVTNVWDGTKGAIPTASPQAGDASASWPETWSNGSTYGPGPNIPPDQKPGNYPFTGVGAPPNPYGYFTDYSLKFYIDNDQGNVRNRQLALIKSAKKTLLVYNEEMADTLPSRPSKTNNYAVDSSKPYLVNALVGAAQRGVQVTIVMANEFTETGVPNSLGPSWASSFNALVSDANYPTATYPNARKPTILLLDENGSPYIHGKAIVADGVDGWFGSINSSTPSMNDNRELGLGVTSRTGASGAPIASVYSPQMIAAVTSAGASDSAAGTSWLKAQAQDDGPYPKTWSPGQFPCINTQENADSGLPARLTTNIPVPPQGTPPTQGPVAAAKP
ncbi:MAG: phospholipase D-like domain-containing protein [Actinomycetota bacterium]